MLRRLVAAALMVAVLTSCVGFAEMDIAGQETLFEPEIETVYAVVEMMFAAATGTTVEEETEAREGLTEEELLERNQVNAEYRAVTRPWLLAALCPEEAVEAPVSAGETPEAEVEVSVVNEEEANVEAAEAETEPVWTVEDSYAAMQQNELGAEYLTMLEPYGGVDMQSCLEIAREFCKVWMADVDHVKLFEMNDEYVFWIYAPGTQIDYPVVHGDDNKLYLDHMFNGDYNSAGTLFVDYRNLPEFMDPNTLIYGHHMRNDSMFGALTDYEDQAFFEAHPYLLIFDADEYFLVEVFAGYTTSSKDHCYDIAISDEQDMADFVNAAYEKSDFESGVEIGAWETLVTLSTCAYAFENARYIVIGRLVPVWEKTEVVNGE